MGNSFSMLGRSLAMQTNGLSQASDPHKVCFPLRSGVHQSSLMTTFRMQSDETTAEKREAAASQASVLGSAEAEQGIGHMAAYIHGHVQSLFTCCCALSHHLRSECR